MVTAGDNYAKEQIALWYHSFPDFCKDLVKIQTDEGEFLPLVLNEAQLYVYEEIDKIFRHNSLKDAILILHRWLILKGRQMGISTMVQAFFCWLQWRSKGLKSKTLAQDEETTKSLFSKIKLMFDELPDAFRPPVTKDTESMLRFGGIWKGTELTVKTGSAKTAGRGSTVQLVHISELGFWEFEPEIPLLGLRQSVPRLPITFIIIESTANGVGNHFHELWINANLDKNHPSYNKMIPLFLPWTLMKKYARAVNEFDYDITAEEMMLKYEFKGQLHPLSDEQIMFRRDMIAENGERGFRQEYPLTADEAFLSTGEKVFDDEEIAHYRNLCTEPKYKGDFEIPEGSDKAKFIQMKSGPLHIWELPRKGARYMLCNDVATGQGKDSSVFCILRLTENGFVIVATYQNRIDAVSLAYPIAAAHRAYHNALLVLDRNSTGIDTIHELIRIGAKYKARMFRVKNKAKKKTSETQDIGVNTGPRNKTSMVERMANRFRNFEVTMWDLRIVKEMETFVYGDEEIGEKAQASKGAHDDFMMCLAIGAYAFDSKQAHAIADPDGQRYKPLTVRWSSGI